MFMGEEYDSGRERWTIEDSCTLEYWARRGTDALQLQIIPLSQPAALLAYQLPGAFHKDPGKNQGQTEKVETTIQIRMDPRN
jgi:PIN domain nuclease of toxin-antitoxin system